MKRADYLVIGAGVVGLACAHELRKRFPGKTILVLEKEARPGLHASGRNSGVLHSGIYYKPDSLKAKVCIRGAHLMRAFAKENGIPLLETGKLIIATEERELAALDRLMQNALAGGIRAELLDEKGVQKLEPYARAFRSGVWVQDTAVIDSRKLVQKLAEILIAGKIEILTDQEVLSIDPVRHEVKTRSEVYCYESLVNCAGAYADKIAQFFNAGKNYSLLPFKGLYYQLKPEKADLVRSNLYPVPREGFPFLGIHFTRHPDGEVYAGPTAIPVLGRENYGIFQGMNLNECPKIFSLLTRLYFSKDPEFRNLVHEEITYYWKPSFVRQAQKLIPSLRENDLVPCTKVGIRPQLINLFTDKLEMDYVLEKAGGSIHVLNAISPAFTSAFAFAEVIAGELESK